MGGARGGHREKDDKVHDSIIEERIQRERPCRTLFIRNIKASHSYTLTFIPSKPIFELILGLAADLIDPLSTKQVATMFADYLRSMAR